VCVIKNRAGNVENEKKKKEIAGGLLRSLTIFPFYQERKKKQHTHSGASVT